MVDRVSLKACNELTNNRYDSLPRFEKNNVKERIKKIAFTIWDFTVIGPVGELLVALTIAPLFRLSTRGNCTPQMKDRLAETTAKIHEIAKKAGVVDYKRFKVCVSIPFASEAALHRSTIFIPPESLLRPEDLPCELKLARLDNGEISEDEWIVKFLRWFEVDFCKKKQTVFKSQYDMDMYLLYVRHLVESLRNPKKKAIHFEAVIGHELGHSELYHTRKSMALYFALQLLAWPTLGLYKLFQNRLLEKVSRKHEREADLFSAKRLQGAKGLISSISDYMDVQKALHPKYPERADAKGNNLSDKGHPTFSERIKYLQAYL